MTHQRFRPAVVALLLVSMGAIAEPTSKAPRPGPNFPSLESYYPEQAKRAGQEGAAIIHFCVDTNGKLTSPPTIAVSSGNEALDAGALNLASAGNGFYLPGSVDGVAHEACSQFKIQFELSEDPLLRMANFRIPTIRARLEALGTEYGNRLTELAKTVDKPKPELLATANPETVKAIRQYARDLDAELDHAVGIVADMLDDMEHLGHSPDVPETERSVFIAIWPNERAAFTHKFRRSVGDARNVVRSLDELADYLVFSTQPRSQAASTTRPETPSQDVQLAAIRERVLNAVRQLQGSIDALSKAPTAAGNETH